MSMILLLIFFLMIRRPPITTRTETLIPDTTLFRSECSLVSVPANPNALQMAKSLNLSDEARSLIFASSDPEIPQRDTPAPQSKKGRVVSLNPPADGSVAPFVVREITRA